MEILNKEEMLSCSHYEKEKRPAIEVKKMIQEEKNGITLLENRIVFILEGSLRYLYRGLPEGIAEKGQFYFIPVGGVLSYTAIKNTLMVIIRLDGNPLLCPGCALENLYWHNRNKYEPLQTTETVTPLRINHALLYYLNGLIFTIDGGLQCRHYYDVKIKEVFILLRAYYSRTDLKNFFSNILSPNAFFSEQVRTKLTQCKTVGELAEAMNLSPSQFTKKFRQVFGQSPQKWMREYKAKAVHDAITGSEKPLKEIAGEYGYMIQGHFVRFCKQTFGMTPGELRKKDMTMKGKW